MVAVTSEGSPGDRPDTGLMQSFHMFDFIGGRYSVSSAVGGLPLSLYLGFDRFEAFLRGAEAMDRHAEQAAPETNLPLTAALLDIWNNNFLGYGARAIIPYATPLRKLAPHIQQLNMESNGKSVNIEGRPVQTATGVIIFGEPGTNAQHSFFQLAHQGRPFPIDFIGVRRPQYTQYDHLYQGVTNHQELWANLLSQPMALALGRDHADPARSFAGNRPSSTLLLEDLSPERIGALLSFFEARTVMEGFVWDINPFDQYGVELGKALAKDIRAAMAARNRGDQPDQAASPIVQHYLDILFAPGT
jgi:glucose-6-phosphate isomerase